MWFIVGILIAFAASISYAGGPLTGPNASLPVTGSQIGVSGQPTTTWYKVNSASVSGAAADAVRVEREITVKLIEGNTGRVLNPKVIEAIEIPKPALAGYAKGVLKNAGKGFLYGIAASIIANYAIQKGWEWLDSAKCQVTAGCTAPGWHKEGQPVMACLQQVSTYIGAPISTLQFNGGHQSSPGWFICDVTYKPNGNRFTSWGVPTSSATKNPVTDTEIDDLSKQVDPVGAAKDLADTHDDIDYSHAPNPYKFSSPDGSYKSPPITTSEKTTNPDGSTTIKNVTTQTVWNINDTTINNKNVTTTTTQNTDSKGNASPPETTTTEDEKPDQTPTWTDPSMPTVPDLYIQKYPDGLKGVWLSKQDSFKQTAFVKSLQTLVPSISGGTCPSFSIDTNNHWVNTGSMQIPTPCWIYDFVRAVLMLTAVFVSRAIIFGG
ncbi:hypothetical protein [Aquitalea aquatica]|uniref:TspB protein n=1 Tax=Aquitalea aquatica TaxID=3044273 RepID=A0A838YIB9_9NEIS|nr:hypothetical protein [Aquitalea magnusonii]MBA4710474.1 hypothetical protein [Aquitalea magnusonii]